MSTTTTDKKLVRFAPKNTFHSAHTPGLAFVPSSDSETTPPQTSRSIPRPSQYGVSYDPKFLSNPPHYLQPPRPHHLLESVNWDLMQNPSTITLSNLYSLSKQLLIEQATTPSLPALRVKLSIISSHFPWRIINVRSANGSYVTLEDLFDSIYRSLHTNVTSKEFDSLPQDDKKRATRAYKQRYGRIRNTSAQDEEKRGGMKRIDFLMGRTSFDGISNTSRHSDAWRLNVA